MVRITLQITSEATGIKVEGRLAGESVSELERTWRDVLASGSPKPIMVDLCGVTALDDAGKRMLRTLCRDGASFRSCGPHIAATLEAIRNECKAMSGLPNHLPA